MNKEGIMNVSIWDPFREMEALLNNYTMPARRRTASDENGTVATGDWAPVVDILETENDFVLKVELPGVEKDDVDVSIDNRILTIKGEKKNDSADKKIHRTECRYGTFIRNFTLPQDGSGIHTMKITILQCIQPVIIFLEVFLILP